MERCPQKLLGTGICNRREKRQASKNWKKEQLKTYDSIYYVLHYIICFTLYITIKHTYAYIKHKLYVCLICIKN